VLVSDSCADLSCKLPQPSSLSTMAVVGRFFRQSNGSATVEFVILLPAFFLLLSVTFFAAMTLFSVGRTYETARHVARIVSVGALTDAEGEILASRLLPASLSPTATVDRDDLRNVRISIRIQPHFTLYLPGGLILPDGITTSYVMRRETNTQPSGG
jgi:hypothetical protein